MDGGRTRRRTIRILASSLTRCCPTLAHDTVSGSVIGILKDVAVMIQPVRPMLSSVPGEGPICSEEACLHSQPDAFVSQSDYLHDDQVQTHAWRTGTSSMSVMMMMVIDDCDVDHDDEHEHEHEHDHDGRNSSVHD